MDAARSWSDLHVFPSVNAAPAQRCDRRSGLTIAAHTSSTLCEGIRGSARRAAARLPALPVRQRRRRVPASRSRPRVLTHAPCARNLGRGSSQSPPHRYTAAIDFFRSNRNFCALAFVSAWLRMSTSPRTSGHSLAPMTMEPFDSLTTGLSCYGLVFLKWASRYAPVRFAIGVDFEATRRGDRPSPRLRVRTPASTRMAVRSAPFQWPCLSTSERDRFRFERRAHKDVAVIGSTCAQRRGQQSARQGYRPRSCCSFLI